MGLILFNGRSSADFGIEVESPPSYLISEGVYDVESVPGRNGDMIWYTGRHKNKKQKYNVSIITRPNETYDQAVQRVITFLYTKHGYARLEDSYTPEYYMEAYYPNETEISNIMQEGGKGTLTFERKPQRWLKTGEISVSVQSGGTLVNPTVFDAEPLITLTASGNGTLTVNGTTIQIVNSFSGTMTIDCHTGNAYSQSENLNDYIKANPFPVLEHGSNIITFNGGITSVNVVPRWWTL